MKKAFTLIEMIIVIVILAILSTGSYIALKQLYIRAAKSKAISELSFDSTIISQQLSALLSNRVPSTVIGYDTSNNQFESIYSTTNQYEVLEWIGSSDESFKRRDYSTFVDLDSSDRTTRTLSSPDTNMTLVKQTIGNKFNLNTINIFDEKIVSLVFAGTFDEGGVGYSNEFNNSFGWHGYNSNKIYAIDNSSKDTNITLTTKPDEIYEKYFLIDSAYAVARGENIDLTAGCIQELNQSIQNNTLFLFHNYRPWKNETFCADPNGTTQEGNVTILSNEVEGFEVDLINSNLIFKVTLKRYIPKNSNKRAVTISKQKVIF